MAKFKSCSSAKCRSVIADIDPHLTCLKCRMSMGVICNPADTCSQCQGADLSYWQSLVYQLDQQLSKTQHQRSSAKYSTDNASSPSTVASVKKSASVPKSRTNSRERKTKVFHSMSPSGSLSSRGEETPAQSGLSEGVSSTLNPNSAGYRAEYGGDDSCPQASLGAEESAGFSSVDSVKSSGELAASRRLAALSPALLNSSTRRGHDGMLPSAALPAAAEAIPESHSTPSSVYNNQSSGAAEQCVKTPALSESLEQASLVAQKTDTPAYQSGPPRSSPEDFLALEQGASFKEDSGKMAASAFSGEPGNGNLSSGFCKETRTAKSGNQLYVGSIHQPFTSDANDASGIPKGISGLAQGRQVINARRSYSFDASAYGNVLPRPLHPVCGSLPDSLLGSVSRPLAFSHPVASSFPGAQLLPPAVSQACINVLDGMVPLYDDKGVIVSYVTAKAAEQLLSPESTHAVTTRTTGGSDSGLAVNRQHGVYDSIEVPVDSHVQAGSLPSNPPDLSTLMKAMQDSYTATLTGLASLLKANNASVNSVDPGYHDEGQDPTEEVDYYSDEDYDEDYEESELNLQQPVFVQPAISGNVFTVATPSVGADASGVGGFPNVVTSGRIPNVVTSGMSISGLPVSAGAAVESMDASGVPFSELAERDSPLSVAEVRGCLVKHGVACNVPAPAAVSSRALDMLGCAPRRTEVFKLFESNLIRSAWEVFDASLVPDRADVLPACGPSTMSASSNFSSKNPSISGYNASFYNSVPLPGKEPLPIEMLLDKEVTAFGVSPAAFKVPLGWSRCKSVQDNVFRALSALSFTDNAMSAALLETAEANSVLTQDTLTGEDVLKARESLAVSHRTMGSAMLSISHSVQLLIRASANLTTAVRSAIIQNSVLDDTIKESLLHVPMHAPSVFAGCIPLAATRHQAVSSFNLKRPAQSNRGRATQSNRGIKRPRRPTSSRSNDGGSSRGGGNAPDRSRGATSNDQQQQQAGNRGSSNRPFRGRGGRGGRGKGARGNRGTRGSSAT